MPRARVVVVGAGISGLGAAYALARAGMDVRLLEASDEVGGVIRSERVDGYLVEHGPHSALNSSCEVESLLGELGLLSERVFAAPAARKRFIVRNGRPLPLPSSPWAFVTTPLWSARAKWSLLAEPFARRPPPGREETVMEFVTRRLGREIADYAVDPFVSGVYAGDPNALSMQSTFPLLYALERDHGGLVRGALARLMGPKPPRPAQRGIYSFRTGMGALPRALGAFLGERVWVGASVVGLTRTADGFRLDVERGDERLRLDTERVVLATPADRAAALVRPFTPAMAEDLAAIAYAPVAMVFAAFARGAVAHPLDGFGCLVPARERRRLLGSLWSSSLFPDRAPAGMVAFTNFLGGAKDPEVVRQTDDDLARFALEELSRLFGARGPAAFVRVIRHARGIPQYVCGHEARLKRIEAEAARIGNLALIGNYLRGVSVGDCLTRGMALGRELAGGLSGSR
ncbi:MAG: protoporphyrinogen oxidase [Nitrospirae bacterium]|nr:protoporphyrinogen oxidase [Nitrospirota bacterium]